MKNKSKVNIGVVVIVIIMTLVLIVLFLPFLLYILHGGIFPRKIHNLEYKIPYKLSWSMVDSDVSYYDIGIRGEHEDSFYQFDDCDLRIEYFEDDVTNISELNLVKGKRKNINKHKWYYLNNKYFTNYKGNTYVVTITNSDNCNKINNKVIKSLKLK